MLKATIAPLPFAVAVDGQAVDARQALLGVVGEPRLVRGDPLAADALDVGERRAEADRLDDRRRARLEAVRRLGVGDAVLGDVGDHLAAAHVGRHRREAARACRRARRCRSGRRACGR